MTKREICERLMEIRDYAKIADTWQAENATLRDMLAQIDADLRHLLLDLAATEEEAPPEEPKREEPDRDLAHMMRLEREMREKEGK